MRNKITKAPTPTPAYEPLAAHLARGLPPPPATAILEWGGQYYVKTEKAAPTEVETA